MATKAVNAKSQTVAARVPHEVMNNVEAVKMPGESTGQFVTAALNEKLNIASGARPKNQSNHHQRRGVRYYGALLCRTTQ